MQDRNVEFPNRFRMVKVEGTDDIYDMIPAPGDVLNPGTLLNKENLLPDPTVARIFDGKETVPKDPMMKDALDRLNHQVGEIITTRRTDLGDHWALCNGEYLDAYQAPDLYRMSRESYEYDIVHELDGEHKITNANYTTVTPAGSVVVNNTVYQAVLDETAAVINLYQWIGNSKSYGPVLVQTITYTTPCNQIYISKCADWVFIEAAYQSGYSSYQRAFFAANQSDMQFYPISYLTEGAYAFPNGGGNSGDAISTWSMDFVYCKIKSDGTMGIVMNSFTTYSNSSGNNPRMQMYVLEMVNGKWMCIKAFSTKSYVTVAYATYSVAPYYNPYLGVWQICTQSYNDTYVYLRSIDVATCYASGSLEITTTTNSIWTADGRSYVFGVAYDTGNAIWLIPDYWNDDDNAINYVINVNSITAPTKLQNMSGSTWVSTIRIYGGKIYGFSSRRDGTVKIFDTLDDLINDTGTVLINPADYPTGTSSLNDIAFNQGLYDHVLTGNGIQTPGYKLPAIAPDASYAYIKIKEATDD